MSWPHGAICTLPHALTTVVWVEFIWIVLAVASLFAVFPVWRMPMNSRLKGVCTAGVIVVAAGFALSAGVLPEDSFAASAVLLLGTSTAVLGAVLYFLGRSWLADRADLVRLRATAQRNADQISVVSHEIRTPLALVHGAAELLSEETPGPLTPAQRRFVTTITSNCSSVIDLAQDLLIQARIDAGIFQLQLQRINIRSLAMGVVGELRQLHSVEIALDCPGAPPRAWADGGLIRQAMINLINNAVAHAHQATLVTVRIVSADQQILVSVTDDGLGMSPEARKQLFERFASGRPLRDGTGLGLVITRQIIQMHGGDVLVDTTPLRGTTMLFSIPTGDAGAAEPRTLQATLAS